MTRRDTTPAVLPEAGEPLMPKLLRRLFRHEHEHTHAHLSTEDWELREFDIESEQRYRTMTGMDEPLETRAKTALRNAEQTVVTSRKTW
jgi:hypothetical protein